jgi:hypothetical protein
MGCHMSIDTVTDINLGLISMTQLYDIPPGIIFQRSLPFSSHASSLHQRFMVILVRYMPREREVAHLVSESLDAN